MRGATKWRASKRLKRVHVRRVAVCTTVRKDARVATAGTSTGDYPEEARIRLGEEVGRARRAAGIRSREALAAAAGVSLRSIVKLEKPVGELPVGSAVLEAVARVLPNWTADDPKRILMDEGSPPIAGEQPATAPADPVDEWTEDDEDFYQALTAMLKAHGLKPTPEIIRDMRREWEQQQSETDSDQSNEVG